MKKDSNGAVYCKCGHPEWAHEFSDSYSDPETGTHWPGEPESCNWDIDYEKGVPKCKCDQFQGAWDS